MECSKVDDEVRIAKLYDELAGTAKRFRHEFHLPAVTPGSQPVVMFIGNHSSGKSTYINHLLGGEPVQTTGVAPTDDCFTVLKHGTEERDIKGPAAIMELGKEFSRLETLGPNFLERLQVKYRDRDILKRTVLIDSPGMLDAAAKREYDFTKALEIFSETAAMVVVMFDPDKPGTTGETVDALCGPLAGKISKLHILMNKCDTLTSVFDFCRAYGTLCWNLARVLTVKDIPLVHAGRVPVPGAECAQGLDVAFLDASRQRLDDSINNAGTLRKSTMVASARHDFNRLDMQIRMVKHIGRSLVMTQTAIFAVIAALGFGAASRFVAMPSEGSVASWILFAAVALAVVAVSAFTARSARRVMTRIIADTIDRRFQSAYNDDTAIANRDDLNQYWAQVKPAILRQLDRGWKRMPFFCFFAARRVRKALAALG